ncbi:MAG: lipid IV(A) 3-deoxy-D-manno-octulosonic acid transferase [Arenicella sp.]
MLFYVYRVLIYLLLPVILLMQVLKGWRNKAYWSHWGERFGFQEFPDAPYEMWMHAVSVGEVRAVVPLLQRLANSMQEEGRILLTVTTPTGRKTAESLLGNSVDISYLPYDIGFCVRRFLRSARPKQAVVVETEVWPNLVKNTKRLNIPLTYINVRLSERSFRSYLKVQSLSQDIFNTIDVIAAQGAADANRLIKLGVDKTKIVITGSLKFDVNMPASLKESAHALRDLLANHRTVWICGSTRDGEEGQLIQSYKALKKTHSDLLLVLVPRHPERFDSVARQCEGFGLNVVKRTENPVELDESVDVYLGNTMGELGLLYAASDIAFVGGSLVPFGGQNILEPCALGIPVLFGPNMFNFEEISQLTIDAKAGICVQNEYQLQDHISQLIQHPNQRDQMGRNGLALIEQHKGALDRVEALLTARR